MRQVAGRLGICAGQGRRMISRQNALHPEWMEAVTCGPVSYLGMMWWGSPNKARQPRAQKAYAPWASALGWPDIPPSYVWPDWLSALMGILSCLTPPCHWMSWASWISRARLMLTSTDVVAEAGQQIHTAISFPCGRICRQIQRNVQQRDNYRRAVCSPVC